MVEVASDTFLIADAMTLRVQDGGPATADIWIVTKERVFPMLGWNDFVVVILGWWGSALLRIVHNQSVAERIFFMDGPFAVDLTMASAGMLEFRMIDRSGQDREVCNGFAGFNRFISCWSSQSREVLNECKRQAWWSGDEDNLESLLKELARFRLH